VNSLRNQDLPPREIILGHCSPPCVRAILAVTTACVFRVDIFFFFFLFFLFGYPVGVSTFGITYLVPLILPLRFARDDDPGGYIPIIGHFLGYRTLGRQPVVFLGFFPAISHVTSHRGCHFVCILRGEEEEEEEEKKKRRRAYFPHTLIRGVRSKRGLGAISLPLSLIIFRGSFLFFFPESGTSVSVHLHGSR
jgi:hypothetical protein